jgi:GMP synthase (glutamine-hydrolysing)
VSAKKDPHVFSTLVLRHVAFEDLGAFAPILEQRGLVRVLDVGVDDLDAEDAGAPELVIVLGGPIGVYEEARYPFLAQETEWIARRIAAKRPLLGICLGAQLIAKAAGTRVYPSGVKEIGFAPITLTEAGRDSCLAPYSEDPIALHWHGDTFDLPQGAVLLASTESCRNQGFMLGPNVIGLQFHPEAGGRGFERWLIGHTVELSLAGVDVVQLRSAAARLWPALARKAEAVLRLWLEGLSW